MSKVLKKLYLGDVVKSFGTKQLRKLTTEIPQEDSIIGTWVFKDTLTDYATITTKNNYYVDFECNGKQYIGFTFYYNQFYYRYDNSSSGTTYVYSFSSNKWDNGNDYKTITITGGSDINNSILITWLKANATKIA